MKSRHTSKMSKKWFSLILFLWGIFALFWVEQSKLNVIYKNIDEKIVLDWEFIPKNISKKSLLKKGGIFDIVVLKSLEQLEENKFIAVQLLKDKYSKIVLPSSIKLKTNNFIDDCFEIRKHKKAFELKPIWGPLKIIVLAWNRPHSLKRLLDSLESSYYFNKAPFLEIRVDGMPPNYDPRWHETLEVANNFSFSHGKKAIVVSPFKKGLCGAWFAAWENPGKCGERAVILEDDLTVSPFWFRMVSTLWNHYFYYSELAAISLHQIVVKATDFSPVHPVNNQDPMMYNFLNSWGFSPHPIHWGKFLDFFSRKNMSTFDPRIPGLYSSRWWRPNLKSIWSIYFIYYAYKNDLFTMYLVGNNCSFSAHWREAGVHYSYSRNKPDKKLVNTWEPKWDNPPAYVPKFNWNMGIISEFSNFLPQDSKSISTFPSPKISIMDQNYYLSSTLPDCNTSHSIWNICDPVSCNFSSFPKRWKIPFLRHTWKGERTHDLVDRLLRRAWGPAPPKIDLYVRAGCRAKHFLDMLFESVELFWPRFLGHVIVVLDVNDREYVGDLLPEEPSHSYKVFFEHCPCMKPRIFNQYSYLTMDVYSDAEYVVTIDSDCAFITPVTPDLLFRDGKLILATSKLFQPDYWFSQVDFFTGPNTTKWHTMVTQPVSFYRQSFLEYRKWLKSKSGICLEENILKFLQKAKKTSFFCWMCQLGTFINITGITTEKYFFYDMDSKTETPSMRFAIHFKYEPQRRETPSFESRVQRFIFDGICRAFGENVFPECANKSMALLDEITFQYAGWPFTRTPKETCSQKISQYKSRIKSILDVI